MAIIIPSSSIYEIDNKKVLDNEIYGVDVNEDIIYLHQKSISMSIQPYNANIVLNSDLQTITKTLQGTTYTYAIISFDIKENIGIKTISGFNYSYMNDRSINYSYSNWKQVSRPLTNEDSLIDLNLIYVYDKEITANNHTVYVYFRIRAITPNVIDAYVLSASISFSYYSYEINSVYKNYGNKSSLSFSNNELVQDTTRVILEEKNTQNKNKTYNEIQLKRNFLNSTFWVESKYCVTSDVSCTLNQLLGNSYNVTIPNGQNSSNVIKGNNWLGTIIKINTKYDNTYVYDKNYIYEKIDTPISEYMAIKTIENYKNGKETAVIKCSINDYKNEDGTIAISTTDISKDIVFRMYDKVIPMIRNKYGFDEPMSNNKDGTSKVFKVIGTKLINNGAVWQELTLQEIT